MIDALLDTLIVLGAISAIASLLVLLLALLTMLRDVRAARRLAALEQQYRLTAIREGRGPKDMAA